MDVTVKEQLENASQADRVVWKFGGPIRLSLILKAIGRPKDPSSIHRWMYPKEEGGSGGIIPGRAWPDLFMAARAEGVLLTSEDLDPREKLMPVPMARAFPRRIRRRPGQRMLDIYEQEVQELL